jgi:hypothetical protein
MSMSSGGVSTDEDAMAAAGAPQPAARRGFGSLQSMVISMVVILAAVLAWVAMVPRVRQVNQPAVDVISVATQVRRDAGWGISVPRLPAGWKATNVRFAPVAGIRTWHAGYLSPDGDYVSIDQTANSDASARWISAVSSGGKAEGSLFSAGRTWRKLSSPDLVQRSLYFKRSLSTDHFVDPATKGAEGEEVATVLSGTASYAQLADVAETLVLVKTAPAKPTR